MNINKIPKDLLEDLVVNSSCYREVLQKIDCCVSGASHSRLKKKIEEFGLDTSHFMIDTKVRSKLSNEDYFRKGVKRSGSHLKKRLLDDGHLQDECAVCGLKPEWNNKPLVMQVDHINGDNLDNRLENLRLICPNCHSQTTSFAGKRFKKKYYCDCGKEITRHSKSGKCAACARNRNPSSTQPSKELLRRLIWQIPTTKIAEMYGVSDSAVNKWCKKHGINKPGMGYWTKKRARSSTESNSL